MADRNAVDRPAVTGDDVILAVSATTSIAANDVAERYRALRAPDSGRD